MSLIVVVKAAITSKQFSIATKQTILTGLWPHRIRTGCHRIHLCLGQPVREREWWNKRTYKPCWTCKYIYLNSEIKSFCGILIQRKIMKWRQSDNFVLANSLEETPILNWIPSTVSWSRISIVFFLSVETTSESRDIIVSKIFFFSHLLYKQK